MKRVIERTNEDTNECQSRTSFLQLLRRHRFSTLTDYWGDVKFSKSELAPATKPLISGQCANENLILYHLVEYQSNAWIRNFWISKYQHQHERHFICAIPKTKNFQRKIWSENSLFFAFRWLNLLMFITINSVMGFPEECLWMTKYIFASFQFSVLSIELVSVSIQFYAK